MTKQQLLKLLQIVRDENANIYSQRDALLPDLMSGNINFKGCEK